MNRYVVNMMIASLMGGTMLLTPHVVKPNQRFGVHSLILVISGYGRRRICSEA